MKKTFSILAVLVLVALAIASAMAEAACTHSWMVVSNTNASCSAGGVTRKYCIKCGANETITSSPLGHLWQLTRKDYPTYFMAGKAYYTCNRKGCIHNHKTETLPKLTITNDAKKDAKKRFGDSKQYGDEDGKNEKYIKNIQKALKEWGYDIKVDGKFGPETKNAVKKFQKQHNLKDKSESGVVDENTALELSCK